MGTESCLEHILLVHSDLVITRSQIQLGENTSFAQFIKKLICLRYWKVVWHCCFVQCAIVNAETERVILFPNKKDRRGEWTAAPLNNSLIQHVLDLPLDLVFLKIWVAIRSDIYRFRAYRRSVEYRAKPLQNCPHVLW